MNCKACGNTSAKNTSLSFFRFPKETTKCRDWAERCDLLDLYEKHGTLRFYKSFRICSDHFDSKDIVFDGRKKRLLQSASPLIEKIKDQKEEKFEESKNLGHDETFKLNWCRLCATENINLTDIYGWKGRVLNLESKLKYIPVVINKYDALPLRMCHECISKVDKFHDFIVNCIKAETKLRIMLDMQTHDRSLKVTNISPEVQETSAWDSEVGNNFNKTPSVCSQGGVDDLPNLHFPGNAENDYTKVLQDHFLNKDNTGCFCQNAQPVYTKTNQLINHTNFIKEVDISANISFEHDYSNIVSRDQLLLEPEIQIENDQNFMEEAKHPCEVCLESFCSIEVLNAHSLTHSAQSDSSRELICGTCCKVFFSRFELEEHATEHLDKRHACKICDKKFHKVAFLQKHLLLHRVENSCDCFSDLRFVDSISPGCLHLHAVESRYRPCKIYPGSDEKPESFLRRHSNKSSLYQEPNETNSKLRKTNSKAELKCQFCGKLFKDRQVCLSHERSHMEGAPHRCKECGKTFRSKPSLRQHGSVHSDKRLYSCKECGMSFKRKDTLSNHLRIHTGERPFVCKACGFAFKQRGDCIKHEKNHEKEGMEEGTRPQRAIRDFTVLSSSTKGLINDVSEIRDGTLWEDEKNSSLLSCITIPEEIAAEGSLDDTVPGRMMPLTF